MNDFRNVTPIRRNDIPVLDKVSKYKTFLREDFKQRCGYCGDHDFFRESFYEVDHFVPITQLKTISKTDYTNLVYSCRSCNNFKRSKWPTQNEHIHNDGKKGFIDPCDLEYPNQFTRLSDGSIYPKTELGSWMWSALNLANPVHRIKWKLEEIKNIIKILRNIVDDTSIDDLKIINEMYSVYMDLEEQLRGVPNFN